MIKKLALGIGMTAGFLVLGTIGVSIVAHVAEGSHALVDSKGRNN
jgi:hypothetical protein